MKRTLGRVTDPSCPSATRSVRWVWLGRNRGRSDPRDVVPLEDALRDDRRLLRRERGDRERAVDPHALDREDVLPGVRAGVDPASRAIPRPGRPCAARPTRAGTTALRAPWPRRAVLRRWSGRPRRPGRRASARRRVRRPTWPSADRMGRPAPPSARCARSTASRRSIAAPLDPHTDLGTILLLSCVLLSSARPHLRSRSASPGRDPGACVAGHDATRSVTTFPRVARLPS